MSPLLDPQVLLPLALLAWIIWGIWLVFDYLEKNGPPDGMA